MRYMKRISSLCIVLLFSVMAFAQTDITKFLGIPIDGTKTQMIQKLKAKGFVYSAIDDVLTGEFNGSNVELRVVTNNNKVYRIVVVENVGREESSVRIRFNTLCNQFMKNGKYVQQNPFDDYMIGEDVDISYEMAVKNKRFEASYFQVTEADMDTTGIGLWMKSKLMAKYGENFVNNVSEEELFEVAIDFLYEKISHKSVWFMIRKRHLNYCLCIYYDNEKNRANGEDL